MDHIKMQQELLIEPNEALHNLLRLYAGQHIHFFPKCGNCGDGFISYATYKMFDAYNIKFTPHRQDDIVLHDSVIFIGGGGNLVEGLYSHVADIIRAHCSDNKIVLLPHTIVGYADLLQETFANLTVFCRDPISYESALANGANKDNVHLAHDMTFYLKDGHFRELMCSGSGVLSALRQDAESTSTYSVPDENIDISQSWNGDIWTSPVFCEHATKALVAFVAQYELVVTDRLHVSIAGCFLKKKVILLPNSYFKNRAVYFHSIQNRFPTTSFCDSPKSDGIIAGHGYALSPGFQRSSAEMPAPQVNEKGFASGVRAAFWKMFGS